LNRYLHNRSQAEDVFQNCFMQVYQKAGLFEKGKIFRPWLYSIATHLAIDETRRSKRRTTLSLDKSSSQDPGEGKNNLLEGLESSVNRPDRLAMEEEKKRTGSQSGGFFTGTVQAGTDTRLFSGAKIPGDFRGA